VISVFSGARYFFSDTRPRVEGEGVYLREPQMSDYSAWASLRGESRNFLEPWEPRWARDELEKETYRRRVRYYHRDARQDLGYAFFLFRTSDNALLGGATLSNIRRGVSQSCSLGYWVGAPHARQGNMTKGVRAITWFVFDVLRLHRLEAACLPANKASAALLTGTGFQYEGLARRYLKINGTWQDHWLFALLAEDTVS
jgi:[ribosomal protein S5]-alanine N-acetyltransferase